MMEESKLGYYLTPILKVWVFMFFLLVCTVPFNLIGGFNFLPSISNSLFKDILIQISLIVIVLSALLMMFKVFPPLDFYMIFIRREKLFSEFAKGSGVGAGIMLLCAAALYLNGNVSFVQTTISGTTVFLYLILFLLVSLFEEFLFRAYPLFALSERYPLWFAVFVSGVLFALAHLTNPDLSILGVANIALAGMLFAVYTLQKHSISWAVGAHFAWIFTQATILGYNLSGNKISGIVKATPNGADWISGGKFGIEGSIFCTVFLLVSLGWLLYRNGFGVKEESFNEEFLDNQEG